MKRNLKNLAYIAIAAIAIAACTKSKETAVTPEPQKDNAKNVLAYIKSMGFPESSIVEQPTRFVVEEDILFPKNMKVPVDNGQPKTEQYYTGSIVNAANRGNIRIMVDASMSGMMAEINSAVNQWNAVPSSVKFSVVTSGAYDIYIQDANLGAGVCGQGTFPSSGAAGSDIYINVAQIAGNSFAQRQRTITHEMGHNISFRHTNWASRGEPSATPVPGVGGTDALSIMNGGQCGSGATVLSAKDKQATTAIYP